MSNKTLKPAALAASAIVLGGLALTPSAFAFQPLVQGYALGASAVAGDDKAAQADDDQAAQASDDKAAQEGSCGDDKAAQEGNCGADMAAHDDKAAAPAEAAAQPAFDKADTNHDGQVDAYEKMALEGKCGEGKCGAEKK